MKFSKTKGLILLSMILMSILVANLLSSQVVQPINNTADKYMKVADDFEHLIWFLQITDIHISIFRDPDRITQFKEFCQYAVNVFKPSVVLASGDLTDAKTVDSIGSQQIEGEWKHYKRILDELEISKKTVWLDIRGNHDNFNVAKNSTHENFFKNYSIQGKSHPRSYLYQTKVSNQLYSFVAVDACLKPGPRRPFNFIGLLYEEDVREIRYIQAQIKNSGSNYTIWFGHFPTSCVLSRGEGLRKMIGEDPNGLAYLCGHLHQLGGAVPRMYTLQESGFLELELGDWKDNRMFRLLAIDHGMLSFIDNQFEKWPTILITNPKHALQVNPSRENLRTMQTSSFIRILVFSVSTIRSVKVKIDDGDWVKCRYVNGPLFVSPWNPDEYSKGLHKIIVTAEDKDGRTNTVTQPFSLDGTKVKFDVLSRFVLMTNASTFFKTVYIIFVVISLLPLFIMRLKHKLVETGRASKPRYKGYCIGLFRRLWVLATVDRLFWPLFLYPIYASFGPWSIGYIIEDYIGIIFAWGIYVNDTFLPGAFTYVYGSMQLLTTQIPMTFILAHGVDHRFKHQILKPGKKTTCWSRCRLHIPFSIILGLQILMAYLFWLAYGTMSLLLSPLRLWTVIFIGWLWYSAMTLPPNCSKRAAVIWYSTPSDSRSENDSHRESDISFNK